MTIPVPPDLTTDAADAYRAGYRRACADLAEAAMARAAGEPPIAIRDNLFMRRDPERELKVPALVGDRIHDDTEAVQRQIDQLREFGGGQISVKPGSYLSVGAGGVMRAWRVPEQPGDREPTGLDGRGA